VVLLGRCQLLRQVGDDLLPPRPHLPASRREQQVAIDGVLDRPLQPADLLLRGGKLLLRSARRHIPSALWSRQRDGNQTVLAGHKICSLVVFVETKNGSVRLLPISRLPARAASQRVLGSWTER
jgi:hypothetical protein